jgi:hypothetical protein
MENIEILKNNIIYNRKELIDNIENNFQFISEYIILFDKQYLEDLINHILDENIFIEFIKKNKSNNIKNYELLDNHIKKFDKLYQLKSFYDYDNLNYISNTFFTLINNIELQSVYNEYYMYIIFIIKHIKKDLFYYFDESVKNYECNLSIYKNYDIIINFIKNNYKNSNYLIFTIDYIIENHNNISKNCISFRNRFVYTLNKFLINCNIDEYLLDIYYLDIFIQKNYGDFEFMNYVKFLLNLNKT